MRELLYFIADIFDALFSPLGLLVLVVLIGAIAL